MSGFWSELDHFADAAALRMPDGSLITYAMLAERADAIVAGFSSRSLVAIECENHPECVAAYIGCLRRGVVPLLVDAGLEGALRESLYMRFDIGAVWSCDGSSVDYAWRHLRHSSPALHPGLALLLSTSGTTGSPRLVRLSRKNLQSNAESIADFLEITAAERPITALPMHYSYGLSVINSHLARGACILLTTESVASREFWSFFRDAQATSLSGVPAVYEMLRRLRFERMDLPTLRYMSQAGGRLSPDQVTWFAELAHARSQRFIVMYGQTEATARMSYVPADRVLEKADSIGRAIPDGELFLRDSEGEVIEQAGVVGELVYRGDNVMLGYAESVDDLSAPDLLCGELPTGDLAKKDVDGFFYVVGRLKRFIKVHGNRVGLDEIEQQLQEQGCMAYATGRDDLLLVALMDAALDPVAVARELSGKYKLHHSTIRVFPCVDVPRSSAGKVQYQALLSQLEARLLAG